MISIYVNDEALSVNNGGTLATLVSQLQLENAASVAIAVNDEVIARERWPLHELLDQDQVLLIAPIQGG